MLFPSNEFLLFFLPACLILFLLVRRYAGTAAVVLYLLIASLVFYAWTNPLYVPLILASMTFNYAVAQAGVARMIGPHAAIAVGVSVNLAVLCWFKYSAFLAGALQPAFGFALPAYTGELPLAVSFFTFLQIAYLVDVCTGRKPTGGISDYFLFVTFFPHLIAGPLVHHGELIPQFKEIGRGWRRWQVGFAVGLTIFAVGLFKKIVIADNIAPFADLVFDGAKAGQAPALIQAWVGTLAYALQIYPVLFTVVDRAAHYFDARRGATIASDAADAASCDGFFWVGGCNDGFEMRRYRRVAQGPAAQSRPASCRKTARSGHAVGRKTRMRAAPSTTRAATLIRRRRSVVNSATASEERFAIALRAVSMSQ
jgi:hypothetical protein